MIIALRSLVYNFMFYIVTIGIVVFGIPFLLLPKKWTMEFVYKTQARTCLWLLKIICHIHHEVRGRENLPRGPFIIAAKHQSAWDAFGFTPSLRYPVMILKQELKFLPVLGWYIIKFGFVPVHRGKGRKAILQLIKDVKERMTCRECELFIFPEGTRRAPGAKPRYKQGIYHLYKNLNMPVVPVAVNSGMLWPRRKFLRYPGTVITSFLTPIPPGLDQQTFMARLENNIETASLDLARETLSNYPETPVNPELAQVLADTPPTAAE